MTTAYILEEFICHEGARLIGVFQSLDAAIDHWNNYQSYPGAPGITLDDAVQIDKRHIVNMSGIKEGLRFIPPDGHLGDDVSFQIYVVEVD